MNAKKLNASYRAIYLNGLPLEVYAALAFQQPRKPYHRDELPHTECWNCHEERIDNLDNCPNCDAEAVPF